MASERQKRITLYIGAHKTASALLRRSLAALREDLSELGIDLIRRDEASSQAYFSHIQGINSGNIKWDDPAPKAVVESLNTVLPTPGREVLLTSEDLFSNLRPRAFFPAVGEALRFLQSQWSSCELRVVLYVRSQEAFLTSCYAHKISSGGAPKFSDFMGSRVPRNIDWAALCDRISAVIGRENLIVRPYEVIFEQGPVEYLGDFLELLSVSRDLTKGMGAEFGSGAHANRGLSGPALEIMRFANRRLAPTDRKKLSKFLKNTMSTETHPKPVFWSDADKRELREIYRNSNRRLFAEYMPDVDGAALGYCGLVEAEDYSKHDRLSIAS